MARNRRPCAAARRKHRRRQREGRSRAAVMATEAGPSKRGVKPAPGGEEATGAQESVLAQLVAAANDMVPVLRERAARCEELRRLPDETFRDFREAGFF